MKAYAVMYLDKKGPHGEDLYVAKHYRSYQSTQFPKLYARAAHATQLLNYILFRYEKDPPKLQVVEFELKNPVPFVKQAKTTKHTPSQEQQQEILVKELGL